MSTEKNKLVESKENPVKEAEVLDDLPPEDNEPVERLVSTLALRQEISSAGSEIAKKVTEGHITQFLNTTQSEMEHSYEEKKHRKIFSVIVLVLLMAFLIVLIVLLKSNPDVMEKIIYTAGGLIAGVLGGYGLGKRNTDD